MTTTKKLKLWSILTHALIVVGFGHGIITLGLLEIIWFPLFEHYNISIRLDSPFQSRIPMVVILTMLGQISLVFSILNRKENWKVTSHLLGLVFLWLSIVYFAVGLSKENNVHFAAITAVPFFICTLLVFIARPLRRIFDWAIDK